MEDIYTQISNFFRNLFYSPVSSSLQELGVQEEVANNIEIVIATRDEARKATGMKTCGFTISGSLAENGGKNSLSFKLGDNLFVKIQLSDQTDPLINEVVINRIINQNGLNSLFSKYIDHCVYEGKQALVTEYMNITSIGEMFDRMPQPSDDPVVKKQYCALLKQLDTFVGEYMKFADTIGFTHNDMHFGNLVIHESKFKVIDYGRSCLDYTRVPDFEGILQSSCSPYGLDLDSNVIKGLFPMGVNGIPSSSKRLAFFQVVDPNYGYMTDIASVCLMVLPLCGSLFTWPECCTFDLGSENFIVDLSKPRTNSAKYANLYKGVYFLAAYIAASHSISNDTSFSIHIDKLLRTLFWPNGICKNTEYHKVMVKVRELFNTLSSPSTGGHKRKTQKGGTGMTRCARKKRVKAFSTSTNYIITELVRKNFETLKTNLEKTMSKPCKTVLPSIASAAAAGGNKKKKTQHARSKINILKQ